MASTGKYICGEDALRALRSRDDVYDVLFEHGTLELGLYQPHLEDPQKPHDQDEVYIIAEGHGRFRLGDEEMEFARGDLLFVPAGVKHRFESFSEDFSAWVVFYGPTGGESTA